MQTTLEQIKSYTALWRETNSLYEAWAGQHGLSYYELLVILSLSETDGPCRQKDICTQWVLPKQTVNTILKSFQKRSWITLVPSQEDRRNKEIKLTKPGRDFIAKTVHAMQRHECMVLDSLGPDQVEELIQITRLYNQYFKEADSNEPT